MIIGGAMQPDDVIAIAASYDATGRYGAQTPFSDQLNSSMAAGKWLADSLHDSIITVGNGGMEQARAQLTFYYHGGQDKYQVEQTLAPEEQMWLDLGKLIRDQVPGKDGKTIPPEVTSGVYQIEDLSHVVLGPLYEAKLIVDKTNGHAFYGCYFCCGQNGAVMGTNPLNVTVNGVQGQTAWSTTNCGDGPVNLTGAMTSWWTGDTSIATASNANVYGVGVGSTGNFAEGLISVSGRRQCTTGEGKPSAPSNVCSAVPTNFQQQSCSDKRNGDLHFVYAWGSSTGKLADLAGCTVGEIVTYPGTQNPWPFPSPPFPADAYANPTVGDVDATTGTFTDDHLLTPSTTFVKPYSSSSFTATQYYRYKCACTNGSYVNIVGPISIVRSVSSNGKGGWEFTVSKSDCQAIISPLP
jgi:hypothetical protein